MERTKFKHTKIYLIFFILNPWSLVGQKPARFIELGGNVGRTGHFNSIIVNRNKLSHERWSYGAESNFHFRPDEYSHGFVGVMFHTYSTMFGPRPVYNGLFYENVYTIETLGLIGLNTGYCIRMKKWTFQNNFTVDLFEFYSKEYKSDNPNTQMHPGRENNFTIRLTPTLKLGRRFYINKEDSIFTYIYVQALLAGAPEFFSGYGYGLGVSVRVRPKV